MELPQPDNRFYEGVSPSAHHVETRQTKKNIFELQWKLH